MGRGARAAPAELTVDDLVGELKLHCEPRQHKELRRLTELHDVSELGKQIRMRFGADVLLKTLHGLQGSHEVAHPAVLGALRDEEHGAHVLFHALLCESDGPCGQKECTAEVAKMKSFLQRMSAHADTCSIANLPGGRGDCATCAKWMQLLKLKDRFTRKLLSRTSRRDGAAGAAGQAGVEDAMAMLPGLIGMELEVQRERRASLVSATCDAPNKLQRLADGTRRATGSGEAGAGSSAAGRGGGGAASSSASSEAKYDSRGNLIVCTLVEGCTKPAWHSGACTVCAEGLTLGGGVRGPSRRERVPRDHYVAEPAPPPALLRRESAAQAADTAQMVSPPAGSAESRPSKLARPEGVPSVKLVFSKSDVEMMRCCAEEGRFLEMCP